MRLFFGPLVSVAFAALLFSSSSSSVSAQQSQSASDVPTFSKELPPPIVGEPDPDEDELPAPPQLRPIAPSMSSVYSAGMPEAGFVRVIPPAPRVVVASNGSIAIPGKGVMRPLGFTARPASSTTPMSVNSPFGWRSGRMHTGIDFQASYGDSVGASMSGTVVFAGVKHGYGNFIVIDHGNGVASCYAHLSAMYVGVGQSVDGGQLIGAVGTTGRSTGPHLHYEVRINNKPINPTSTISIANGQILVNGAPFVEEAPTTTQPSGDPQDEPAAASANHDEDSRPRRVSR